MPGFPSCKKRNLFSATFGMQFLQPLAKNKRHVVKNLQPIRSSVFRNPSVSCPFCCHVLHENNVDTVERPHSNDVPFLSALALQKTNYDIVIEISRTLEENNSIGTCLEFHFVKYGSQTFMSPRKGTQKTQHGITMIISFQHFQQQSTSKHQKTTCMQRACCACYIVPKWRAMGLGAHPKTVELGEAEATHVPKHIETIETTRKIYVNPDML